MVAVARPVELAAVIQHLAAPRHAAATSAWHAMEALSAHALTAE
jgi:hypothetical protein